MKAKRKVLSLLMSGLLLTSMVPASAIADPSGDSKSLMVEQAPTQEFVEDENAPTDQEAQIGSESQEGMEAPADGDRALNEDAHLSGAVEHPILPSFNMSILNPPRSM